MLEYLRLAYQQAAKSPDPSNQNGAVVLYKDVHYVGYNDFVEGVTLPPDILTNRDKKLFYIEHAERAAIYNAAYFSCRLPLATLVCPWFACADCARAIILTGIKRVVGHQQRMEMTPDRWKASVFDGLQMMRDVDIQLDFLDIPKLGGCEPINVNGEKWVP